MIGYLSVCLGKLLLFCFIDEDFCCCWAVCCCWARFLLLLFGHHVHFKPCVTRVEKINSSLLDKELVLCSA